MSDCWLNIRFLFWHIQITTYGKWRFSFNNWAWRERKTKSFLMPFVVYEFDLRKRNTNSIGKNEN